MNKATDTHSEGVILITFPKRQRLHERASVLRTHAYCVSFFSFNTYILRQWKVVQSVLKSTVARISLNQFALNYFLTAIYFLIVIGYRVLLDSDLPDFISRYVILCMLQQIPETKNFLTKTAHIENFSL